jgi:hypothetical protein
MAVPSMPISPVFSPFFCPSATWKARGDTFLDRICGERKKEGGKKGRGGKQAGA